jgi:predicted RNA-binding protein YlxR (DUF448 family)
VTIEALRHETADDAGSGLRERRCIVTGEVLPEGRLVRFVASPDGHVVPDVEAKLPGRGLWVSADRSSVEQAAAKRLFSKAAKAPLDAEVGLAARTEERLAASLLSLLGIARRAGALVLGFDQVEQALRSEKPPVVVIEAAEASPEGARKLRAAATARGIAPFVVGALTKDELSLALGRENVVHAALKSGRIAERAIFEAGRLSGFRPLNAWVWAGYSAGGTG